MRLGFPRGLIRDEALLWQFVSAAFGVKIPYLPVCPGHCSPWDVFRDAYWAVHPVMVVKASRAFGGKSFSLSLLGSVEALTLGAEVNVLGGSGEQSRRVLAYVDQHSQAEVMRAEIVEESQHRKTLSNGGHIQALKASQTSVRGPHPQRLRMDEVDEMDLALLDAALGQPMSKRGVASQTLISSTHQHPDGTMTECLRRQSTLGWKLYEYCYQETLAPHGWLSPRDLEQMRASIPLVMWQTEFEGQEPNPEGRAIAPDVVERMFSRELGVFTGADGQYVEIEPPVPGAVYSHGADWARKVDRTVIVTRREDVRPRRVVAFEAMNRRSWPFMIGRFEERVRRFGGDANHDGTGIGDVVDGYLSLSPKPEGVILVGRERQDTVTEYINDCEKGEIVWPYIELAYNEHRYASQDDVYGGGHLPDTICAGALSRRAALKKFRFVWASA